LLSVLGNPSLFSLRNFEYKLAGKICRLCSKIIEARTQFVNSGFRNVKESSALNIAENLQPNF
jgi:hypothetical protein